MRKPDGYDEAQAITGDTKALPPGGYVCQIKNAVEQTTKTGKTMLVLLLDVAEGEYTEYFQRIYDANTSGNKKWPNGGIYRQLTEGKSIDFFKGMITCIEKSNPGYVAFDANGILDEKLLRGKLIGCVFGREQYEKDNGSLAFATKVMQVRSIEAIRAGVEPPEDKLLSRQEENKYNSGLGQEIAFDYNDLPF